MAYVSPEYVAKMQLEENLIYWKIKDPTKKFTFREQLNAINVNESSEILQDFLSNCQGDFVTVLFYAEKPKKLAAEDTGSKKPLELKVKLKAETVSYKNQSVAGIGFADYNSLREKLFQLELEHQRKELEREYSKEPTWFEKILENDKVQLIVTALITKMAENKTAAAPITIAAPDNTDELTNVLIRMSKIDPDYKNTLTKLVQYLEKNPAVLNQIKPIFGA
jgi:hypothetical protein